MRSFYPVLAGLLLTTFAGCVNEVPDRPPAQPTDAAPAVFASVEWAASGEAGEWVFVFVPAVNATTDISGRASYRVATNGAGNVHHVAWLGPTWITPEEVDYPPHFLGGGGTARIEEGNFRLDQAPGWSSGAELPPLGMAWAFASDAPWEMAIGFEPEAGIAGFHEPVIIRGENATAQYFDPDGLVGVVEPTGAYSVEGAFTSPGWRIIQFQEDTLWPASERTYRIEIPGHVSEGNGSSQGYNVGLMASASHNLISGLTQFHGEAGAWRVDVEYREVTVDLPVLVFDMPTDSLWPTFASRVHELRHNPF